MNVSNGEELYEQVAASRGPSQRRLAVWIALLGGSLAVATIVGVSLIGGFSDRIDSAEGDRALACKTARLISFVPAIQFEGEPEANFRGWVDARRDLLVEVRRRQQCSRETVMLLEDRVARDRRLLRQLDRRKARLRE